MDGQIAPTAPPTGFVSYIQWCGLAPHTNLYCTCITQSVQKQGSWLFYRRKRKTNFLPGGFLHRGDKDSFGSWWALTCHVVPNRRTNRLGHRSSNPLVISSVKLRTNLEIVTNGSAIYVFLQNGDAVRFPTSNNGIARREAFIKNSQHRKAASRLFLTATLMR